MTERADVSVGAGGGEPGAARDGADGLGPELSEAVSLIVARLGEVAREDAELARACGVLGRWLVGVGAEGARRAVRAESARREEPEAARVERRLDIGGESVSVSVPDDGRAPERAEAPARGAEQVAAREPEVQRAPPGTIAARARLKAECCRWAIERRKRIEDGADFEQLIKPRDTELVDRLRRLPNCYGWAIDPYVSLPDDRVLDDAAGCYEALADAAELAEHVRGDEELFERYGQRSYELLAECCSALRKVLIDNGAGKDADQDDAFDWLRTRGFEDRVYVARHMRLDDPADPTEWPDRREEISRLGEEIDTGRSHVKEVRNLLGRVGYIAKRWEDYAGAEAVAQAHKLGDTIERLVALGVRPSDPRIRDPLLSVADEIPDDVEPGGAFAEALRYADEHAARREAESRPEAGAVAAPTADVLRARELLGGKVAVLIGGVCRPKSRDLLTEGLGLRELRWVSTRVHESVSNFEAHVRREDVAVVMLAIRWASHSFDEIKAACDEAGKPYVRLPRGYGVNQVAKEIVSQVSGALASAG